MSYQIGTEFITHNSRRYALLRHMNLSDARELLACLLRPSLSPRLDAGRLAAQVSEAELQAALPKMCRIIEQAFGDVS